MSQEDTLVKADGVSIVDRLIGDHQVSRRSVLKALGAGSVSMVAGGILDACGSLGNTGGSSSAGTIKIGYVSPLTGPAAGFGEPDPYVVSLARKAWANGITVGSKKYDVQIITEDSQSGPRAQQAASDLINTSNVDLILATSAPETVNPVADAAEAAGVPCISTVVPWESWYFGRQANPAAPVPFKWTFHFAFGVAQFASAYQKLWPQVPTNKVVGVMWPNDADGNAIRGALGPLLKKGGYTIVDPGAYADGSTDFTAQISLFKQKNCEIFNTFPIPPDFVTFWEQAAQQGYKPKIAQIAKTGLFPSQVEALGSIGNGLASGVYWAPTWPYTSSLTGVSSKDLATGYEASSHKEWNQQAGASLALFDVANAALKASGDPKNKQAVATAMKTLAVDTPLGHLAWGGGATPPNVVATPIIGGQWVATPGKAYPIDFVICENSNDANVPIAATLTAYS
ncbi:MAG TPA: ABC transporter substrate-binding protein [Candidatus Saccharimonadales bacterium]|nr:ABC transporter substrate-binding protein [Candidatus Saccharimonadales bacterium]